MPLQAKLTDQSWYYHAPAKSRTGLEPMPTPVVSQIPLLGGTDKGGTTEEDTRNYSYFKDTDSKYVRLCKQGGRQDLIAQSGVSFQPSQEAVGYPRNDWFYLEDNAQEDEKLNGHPQSKQGAKHEFMLPEYMVHEAFDAGTGDNVNVNNSVPHHRVLMEGELDTNIAEYRKPGYGVRQEKFKAQDAQRRLRANARFEHPQPVEVSPQMRLPPKVDPTYHDMRKILSYGYQTEWLDDNQPQQYTNVDFSEDMVGAGAQSPNDKMVSTYELEHAARKTNTRSGQVAEMQTAGRPSKPTHETIK